MPISGGGGIITVPASGYVGPGDITTFFGWWGLRGYNAAYSSSAIDIEDVGSAHPQTISIDPTTHLLDMIALNSWISSWGTAYVHQIYDQTGGSNHLNPSNHGQSPLIEVGSTGLKAGYPSITFNPAASQSVHKAAGLGTLINQPWSMSTFALAPTGSATGNIMGGRSLNTSMSLTDGTAGVYAGTTLSATAAHDAWHAINVLAADTASYVYVDSTSTGPAAAGNFTIGAAEDFGYGGVFDNFNGKSCEAGIISSDQRSNFLTLAANQRAFWLP